MTLEAKGRGQEDFRGEKPNVYPATGSGSLSLTTAEPGRFKFIEATVKFDVRPATSEDVVLSLDAVDGAAFDAVERRVTPADGTGTGDVIFKGHDDDKYEAGDQLRLTFTNTDARTFGARITVEPL